MPITDIVLDFDGTCTQIPLIYKEYLDRYLKEYNKRVPPNATAILEADWQQAQEQVKANSPKAGWTLGGSPAAPAAADPYILAAESAKYNLRKLNPPQTTTEPPFENHRDANDAHPAPWRVEARATFEELLKKNIKIHFISNSSSSKIKQRLQDLWGGTPLPVEIAVQSDANKFRVSELFFESSLQNEAKSQFENLPVTYTEINIGRPIYLRRAFYFDAICKVFKNDLSNLRSKLSTTVFCGDIWEMDLAMPYALGANIHLIDRAVPFKTYDYEYEVIKKAKERGKGSPDLSGLLAWV